ncbi:MAG: FtsK/SpoIIIE domain-containing protein [Candidatus Nanoarchaeia archaeon]|nr:FtsK/SpoIIIE domain-containing protein [Candidatus Nanoarchaeia archaeon]
MISTVLSNIIGFIMLIIVAMCFFKCTRKLLIKLLKYTWSKIELRKISINAAKRFLAEFKTAKNLFDRENKSERYMYLACTIISFIILVIKYKLNYILFLSPFTYFIFKSLTKEVREYFVKMKHDSISKKYKDIAEMFNNQVKVIEVNGDIYKLHSFIPVEHVKKKEKEIEHWLNKEVLSFKRDPKNFKLITIRTRSLSSKTKTKFQSFYPLQEYIKTLKVDTNIKIPMFLGVDENSKYMIEDLAKLKHIFISGESDGGKSTLLNVIMQSLMYLCGNISFLLVDYKLVELGTYSNFKNCYLIENNNDLLEKIDWLDNEMMDRYREFKEQKIKDIWQYHKLGKKMSYIIFVIDEISNVKLTKRKNKKNDDSENDIDLEESLARILNMARAAGIFIIAATQNPKGVEIDTKVRDKFITNISGKILRKRVQETTTVLGTENLKKGEFKMNSPSYTEKMFKAFYVEDLTHNEVFKELEKMYIDGGVNLEKNIIDFEKFKNKN